MGGGVNTLVLSYSVSRGDIEDRRRGQRCRHVISAILEGHGESEARAWLRKGIWGCGDIISGIWGGLDMDTSCLSHQRDIARALDVQFLLFRRDREGRRE